MKELLREWLGIKDPINYEKELKKSVEEYKIEQKKLLDKLWPYLFVVEKKHKLPCTVCKKQILMWPFNKDNAYYIEGNNPRHLTCEKKS